MATETSASSYQGNPLLKLVESFVMKAIGAINPSTEEMLKKMTPKLQQIYGRTGSWDEIIKGTLDLPPDIEAHIREQWERQRTLAADSGHILSAEEFTVAYVDKLVQGPG